MSPPDAPAAAAPDNPASREKSSVPEVWAIVELMGHLTRVGRISSVKRFGTDLMQIEIPVDGGFVTEEVGGSAIYRLRYVTEAVARDAASRMGDPRPIAPAAYRDRPALEHHHDHEGGWDEPF